MAQLSSVIGSILRDIVSAQHEANLYSLSLGDSYGKDGKAKDFQLPNVMVSDMELDLKKAASVSKNKKVEMTHMKELLGLTGYIRGGCSPIGMKKKYPTFIDETCILFDEIAVSAGVRGEQVILNPQDLVQYIEATEADITKPME